MPPLVLFIFKKFNVLSKLIVLDFVNFVEVARGNASVCGTRVHALEFCDNVDGGRKRELEVDKGSVEIGLDFVPFVVWKGDDGEVAVFGADLSEKTVVDGEVFLGFWLVIDGFEGSPLLFRLLVFSVFFEDGGDKSRLGNGFSFRVAQSLHERVNVVFWGFGHVEIRGVLVVWLFVTSLQKQAQQQR